ncbi:LysR substrate-binding domain-containing protein [Sphingobium sp. AN641]|uniref:LysR substrate-binding domain-containing protein n=1 Tax=Sphingobium sp. AN641 TaxID=3133443 RepID=UPI0030C0E03D
MQVNLPTNLLRSFVAIADTGSIVRATDKIFLTQSALSLQMKRLSEIVQVPLFRREQGTLVLTASGERLLGLARQILDLNDQAVDSLDRAGLHGPVRIGIVQDFGDDILSGVLPRFVHLNPEAELQIRVGNSREIKELLSAQLIDIAVYYSVEADDFTVSPAQMIWLGDPRLVERERLPLAFMAKPCLARDCAIAALEAANRPYQVIVETSNISALRVAVEAGLALTCRSSAFLGHRFSAVEVDSLTLPTYFIAVRTLPSAHGAIAGLADLITQAIENLVCPPFDLEAAFGVREAVDA